MQVKRITMLEGESIDAIHFIALPSAGTVQNRPRLQEGNWWYEILCSTRATYTGLEKENSQLKLSNILFTYLIFSYLFCVLSGWLSAHEPTSSIPRLLPKRQGEKMAERWRLRGACRITEGAEEGGAVRQATCLSGPGIGNHFICITQFSVAYQWPDSPTELVLYSRYTNLSIQSKHPYQHTALHHNEVWIVLVSCCVPTVVLFPSQEAQFLRPSAVRKMASKIILLAI